MVIDGDSTHLIERTTFMPTLWAGIDAGKRTHHCVVIDRDGIVLLSTKVSNDETELLDLIATVIEIDDGEVCWATDLTDGGAGLLIALLAAHGQQLLYLPGRIVHHAAATYRGDGKTDAKDARIIADQARMRTDLQPVRIATEIAVDLRLLTSHRLDVIHDRVRASTDCARRCSSTSPRWSGRSTTRRTRPRPYCCPTTRPQTASAGSVSPSLPRG